MDFFLPTGCAGENCSCKHRTDCAGHVGASIARPRTAIHVRIHLQLYTHCWLLHINCSHWVCSAYWIWFFQGTRPATCPACVAIPYLAALITVDIHEVWLSVHPLKRPVLQGQGVWHISIRNILAREAFRISSCANLSSSRHCLSRHSTLGSRQPSSL